MKKSILTIFQYLFFFGLGILFVWLSIKNINHEQWLHIKNSLRQARHWFILPVFFMLLLSHYIRALRWKILMEPMGYHPMADQLTRDELAGFFANIETIVARTAAHLPTQEEFIAQHCAAGVPA